MTDKRGFARNDRGSFEIATAACGSLAMTDKRGFARNDRGRDCFVGSAGLLAMTEKGLRSQ